MNRYWRAAACGLLVGLTALPTFAQEAGEPSGLFPVSEPFESGYLKVGDLHSVYYGLHGNPRGKPVFVLHGGPGYGCYPRLVQYFDPEKWLVVLHDQRGAGRSRPAGELRENTTQHLVEDIERLRDHLEIGGKITVFGGSWGSTLALAYAETHPERVSAIVIRGVWTGTRAELENGYGGQHVRQFFPDAVAAMEAALPPGSAFEPHSLLKIFLSEDDALVHKVATAWIQYAVKTGQLHATDEDVRRGFGDMDIRPGARLACHYSANAFFFEEGQLLRDAGKLKNIPITIINGRYDMTCPPITAWRLHKLLPKSKLIIVEAAGHSEAEPGTTKALIRAVAELE